MNFLTRDRSNFVSQEINPHSPPTDSPQSTSGPKPTSARTTLVVIGVVLIILVILAVTGILRRSHADTVLAERTDELAPPTVNVAPPIKGAPNDNLVLPGNVTAYDDAPIYARTDGYLLHWYYDIGAHVKKGALLAEIATPELDQQLHQAEQELASAEATANNAAIEAKRYTDLVKTNSVSQEATDTFVNQAASTSAAVRSAQANVQRLKELQSFEKVYAPFDGIVTARNIDNGQLITQGTGSELFRMQSDQTLRVYTNVPQVYAPGVKVGMKIPLTFLEHPGKTYTGTLVRTAAAIDPVSRTLLVEIDVNNRSGELLPGGLAQVHLKAPTGNLTFIVPSAAVMFRHEGLRVGTVVGDTAHLVPITIGEDDGATIQIIDGLKASDQVIQDPPDSLIDGEKVTVVHQAHSSAGSGSSQGGQ
jgi:RND family efflux transporter MFP subunit